MRHANKSQVFEKMFVSRRRLLASAGVVGGSIALAACAQKASQAGAPQGSSAPTVAGTPKSGGRLAMNVNNDPFDWDLSYAGKTLPNGTGTALAYESLMSFKTGPGVKYGDLTIQPSLAEKWESPDAQTYAFHLRPGVKFANIAPANGRAVTSSDVQWSYEYWSRTGQFKDKKLPSAQFDWFFEGIDSIQTPDPATVVVHFKEPFAPFINYAASDFNPIVPHEIFDQDGNLHNRIAGTGPFQLDQSASQKGSRWVWKKNPTYWDAGKPYLDEVDWLVLSDPSSVVAAFQTKQIDWMGYDILSCQQAGDLKKSAASATQYEYTLPGWEIYLNVQQAPLTDERVRQAIEFAIDRDAFIKALDCGRGNWAVAGAFPGTFTQEEIKQFVKFDPQRSKQLLAAAGFSNGVDLEFIYPGSEYGDTYIAEMQLLQAQLKPAGINLSLKNIDKADFSNRKKSRKFTMTIQPKGDLLGDVDDYIFGTFYSGSKADYQGVNDPQLDSLLVEQRRESDPSKRQQLIKQAIRYIYDHALGISIEERSSFEYTQSYVKNYAPQFGVHQVPSAATWVQK